MPKKTTINDLRDHLFETLEALKDEDNPMDINRARAVADVARQIIDTAKVEVEYLKVTGGTSTSSRFLPDDTSEPPALRQISGAIRR